jgi:hypothetical protein
MLGRDDITRMFWTSQFETPYLAMLKYLLLSYKVCLNIKLTADLHLVYQSLKPVTTQASCAQFMGTQLHVHVLQACGKQWPSRSSRCHWLWSEPEAVFFDKDIKVRKKQCFPGPSIFSSWCQWSVIIYVREIQQGFKRVILVHFHVLCVGVYYAGK